MAEEKMCVNHQTRRAAHTCRRCGKPICDVCTSTMNGRFCSPDCASSFEEFQGRVSDTPVRRRTRFSFTGCLRTLIVSVVLLVVIYVALWQLFGTTDPGKMWDELGKMWRLAF